MIKRLKKSPGTCLLWIVCRRDRRAPKHGDHNKRFPHLETKFTLRDHPECPQEWSERSDSDFPLCADRISSQIQEIFEEYGRDQS